MDLIVKYPRTQHLEGSRLQAGDEDLSQVKYESLKGKYIVVEEKFDGGNTGVSFNDDLDLRLQSRGHYLVGGPREHHFDHFKRWAKHHQDVFFDFLSNRYIMYGEWMANLHTVYYDRLPHYFLEFDIYDKLREVFLSTAERRKLIGKAPIVSVAVLYAGIAPPKLADLKALITTSRCKSPQWRDRLISVAKGYPTVRPQDLDVYLAHDDKSEGLYIKVEENGLTTERYKWVRQEFVQSIMNDDHWMSKPKIPNGLMPGCDLFSSKLAYDWGNTHTQPLLTREEFKTETFNKSNGRCLFCDDLAVDAHHIFDRKLYVNGDGGYYIGNGAPVCAVHHLQCEQTEIGIDVFASYDLAPPPFVTEPLKFDKWGNELTAHFNIRRGGPLYNDEGMLKALKGITII